MPDPLYGMGRRLNALEKAASPLNVETSPPVMTVLVFRDDPEQGALAYVDDLLAAIWVADSETVVVVLRLLSDRPRALLPAWAPGRRQWLDYQPKHHEQAQLRPDLLPT